MNGIRISLMVLCKYLEILILMEIKIKVKLIFAIKSPITYRETVWLQYKLV